MELRQYIDLVKRRGWIVLLVCLVATAAAFYVTEQMTPVYRSSTTILVNQTSTPESIQYNDVLTSERLTNTYAELAKQRTVISQVIEQLDLQMTPSELDSKIAVAPIEETQLLRLHVEDPDPALAASIANTTAQVFIADNTNQLSNRPGTVSITELAQEPASPFKPNVRLNTILAAVLGIMIGGAIAFLVEYLDDTVKTAQDVENLLGLTTLGTVARFGGVGRKRSKSSKNAQKAPSGSPGTAALDQNSSEDYRQIRTNIHFSLLGLESKTILVTSANPSEGKTTTATNLAIVLAQAGNSVVLVDADLRRPSVHTLFGSQNSFGLTGLALSESEDVSSALLKTSVPTLKVLPSGPLPPNPSELLMTSAVQKVFEAVKASADYVIFDSPPLLAVTDARVLTSQVDATILVVESGKTRSEAFSRAGAALKQSNTRVLGAIVNKIRLGRQGYYYYGYRKAEQSEVVEITGTDVSRSEEPLNG